MKFLHHSVVPASFFGMVLGLRMGSWLGMQPFSPVFWAYTFSLTAATITVLKLALVGGEAAIILAMPVFVGANLIIGYLRKNREKSRAKNRGPHKNRGPGLVL